MGQLDAVVQALNEKKNGKANYDEILDLLRRKGPSAEFHALSRELDELKKQLSRANKEIDRLKGKPIVKDAASITRRFDRLEKGMSNMTTKLAPKEVDFGPVDARIDALEGKVQEFTNAVMSIKIPEAPEFPEISFPEIPQTNLEPVIDAIEALKTEVDQLKREDVPAPENWTFNIKRNQAGFIKEVEATNE